MIKDQIESILNVTIGLPIWSVGRGGSLTWFAIGNERREIPLKKGGTKIVSEYALHVQCAWRISDPKGIFVASRDRYYPAGDDPYKDLEEFEWDIQGANRCDERLAILLREREDHPLVIMSVDADNVGGVCFILSDSFSLQIFPDDSIDSEKWRFFEPNKEKDHVVVTQSKIIYE